MPTLEFLRSEIERMRVQIGRQRKEILQLHQAGIGTASAEALLSRMQAKVDDFCAQATEVFFRHGGRSRVLEVARSDASAFDA
ncbi:hypothetical protein ABID65_009269 [Bradyrhizobium sp. S3.9.2]|uniref:hypothetical protein n=1 Tax=Bradyrhizobium sp. S3.9.2 TaxID=3156432 RepID=UPI0033995835